MTLKDSDTRMVLDFACQDLVLGCGFTIGVASHVAFFRKNEWDLWAHKIFISQLLHFSAVAVFLRFSVAATQPVIALSFYYTLAFAFGLFLSISFYRLLFHRARHFPGPFFGGLTGFYAAFLSLKSWRQYEEVEHLHREYGDYVRIGPRHLSITDPTAIPEIYGKQSLCVRGPQCNLSPDRYVFNFDRDKATRLIRRQPWVLAFGPRSINAYHAIIAKHCATLAEVLDNRQGLPVNATDVIRYTTFDIAFETLYGKDARCLMECRPHRLQQVVNEFRTEIQLIQPVPWIVSLGQVWPWPRGPYAQFSQQSDQLAYEMFSTDEHKGKVKRTYEKAFDYFLDVFRADPNSKNAMKYLKGDSDVALMTSWDNKATITLAALYHLSQSPENERLVAEELAAKQLEFEAASSGTDKDQKVWMKALSGCEQLNAIINETLRLHPPLSQGVQRMTTTEGLQIGSMSIPGDVVVVMPHHTLFRDPRSFIDPDAFRPERWTSRPELVRNREVFMPFGVGASPCPGRHFAMASMRCIIASIVMRYRVALAPGVERNVLESVKGEKFNITFGAVEMLFVRKGVREN